MAARGWAESRVPVLIVRRRPTPRAFECAEALRVGDSLRGMSAAPSLSGRVSIPVGHGHLEGILREASSAVAAAVVCHPHPRGGGTMNNNVVYRAAKALVGGRRDGAALQLSRRRRLDRQPRRRRGRGGRRARGRRLPARARAGVADLDRRFLVRGARRPHGRGAQRRRREAARASASRCGCSTTGSSRAATSPRRSSRRPRTSTAGATEIEAAVSGMSEPKRLWIVEDATHLFPGQLDPFEHAAEEAVAYLRRRSVDAAGGGRDAALVAAAGVADDVRGGLAIRLRDRAAERRAAACTPPCRPRSARSARSSRRSRSRRCRDRRTRSGSRGARRTIPASS